MANMIKDLLAPSQAKLLDDQLRRRQLQEGVTNYGSDPLGKFLTAASGAQRASAGVGMAAERALGGRQMGVNEAAAVKSKQDMENLKKQAIEAVYANPDMGEAKASALMKAIQADNTGKLSQQVVNKFAVDSMKTGALGTDERAKQNIKSIQLMVNGKQVTPQSAAEAIAAEQKEPGSGFELLKYTSEEAEKQAKNELSAGDRKVYNETLEAQTRLRTQNARSTGLINSLKTVDKKSGVPAQVSSVFKRVTGSEDSESVLNAMVESLRVEQAIGNLPPGVASDKDIALVMGGTLPSTANPEALIEWLSALQRLNQVTIEEQQAKLEWFDEKGSLQGYATHRKEINQERAREAAKKAEEQAKKEAEELNSRIEEKKRKVKELLQQQQTQKANQEAFVESTNIGEFL